MAELSPYQSSRIGGILNDLESIAAERADAIEQAKTKRTEWESEQKASAKKYQEQADKIWKDTIAEIQDPNKGSGALPSQARGQRLE